MFINTEKYSQIIQQFSLKLLKLRSVSKKLYLACIFYSADMSMNILLSHLLVLSSSPSF